MRVPTSVRRAAPRARLWIVLAVGFWTATGGTSPGVALAQQPGAELLAEFRSDPLRFFFEQRTSDAILCSQHVLRGDEFSPEERREALTTLAAIYTSTGKDAMARAAFLEYLSRDPTAELARPEFLPPPVVELFYGIRDSVLLEAGLKGRPDILTIAVGDIENNSIYEGKYDLDRFVRGLSHILVSDLKKASPLQVVDRMRLQVLLHEIGLNSQDQIMNAEYAVPFGKLSGAQSFLFGSLIQIDKNKVRLDLRWVDTASTEILLAEGIEARLDSPEDLLELERTVLLDHLLPRMRTLVDGEGRDLNREALEERMKKHLEDKKNKELAEGYTYADLLLSTGEAVLAEESGDFAAAEAAWRRVHEIDTVDETAQGRSLALQAYLDLGSEP